LNPQVGRESAAESRFGVGGNEHLRASGYPKMAMPFPQKTGPHAALSGDGGGRVPWTEG